MHFSWTAPDGETFPCEEWLPDGGARALLVGVHGLGGAGTDFHTLGERLAREGIACLAPNLRGQGNDPRRGRRGAFLDLSVIARDVDAFLDYARARFPGVPFYVCGESLGALIVSWMLAKQRISAAPNGVIFSAPVVELNKPTPPPVRAAVRMMAMALPHVRFSPAWFVSGKAAPLRVTRDEEHARAVRASSHAIRVFTFRVLNEIGNLIEHSHAVAEGITVPTLTLAGGQDVYLRPEQIEAWFARIPAADKTYRLYPEAFHLLWNDWDKELVMGDILGWIEAHS